MDVDKLNRIKRVLKAQGGAKTPYVVKSGDTLGKIVAEYNRLNNTNLDYRDVAAWSGISNPNLIKVGQTIVFEDPNATIPATLDSTLTTGDTLTAGSTETPTQATNPTPPVTTTPPVVTTTPVTTTTEASQPSLKIPGDLGITPDTAVNNSAKVAEIAQQQTITTQAAVANSQTVAEAQKAAVEQAMGQSTSPNGNVVPTTTSPNAAPATLKDTEANLDLLAGDARKSEGMHLKGVQDDIKKQLAAKKAKQDQITTQIANASSQAFTSVGNILGSYQAASDSELTQGITAGYKAAQGVAENFGPIGEAVSGIMGIASATGDILQSLGGGTDQQSTLDKWMDSPLLSWNVGAINGFFGKNSNKFAVDSDVIEQVGSSYGGSVSDLNDAAKKANKKYGLFSSKSRKKANKAIAKAQVTQNLMADIGDTAEDQRLAVQSMGEQAGLAYSMMTGGGYDQKYTYAAKQGGILEWNPLEILEWEPQVELNWELPTFKEGGNIDITEELEWIPELQKGGKTRTLEQLFEYAKKENPRFIQRLSESPKGIDFIDENGEQANGSHLLSYSTDNEGNAIVFPQIQEMEDGSLHYFEDWRDAYDRAVKNKNILKMSQEEADLFFAEDPEYYTAYKRGWPDFFKSYKKGGALGNNDIPEIEETNQKNVIPEGALHKNKHHMEHADGLTKKGIPVIDEDGEQQAEIEHSEIIFTLEVTKKLEEYYEIFYSEETSNKEKEQAALDAGKLLVYQILENTEDRTGLIESCKKGGSLTLKKSTDDLIEEALEWVPTITIIEQVQDDSEENEPNEDKKSSKKHLKSDKDLMKEAIKEVLIELLTK